MLKELAKLIADNAGTAFLVGGAVRDELLGKDNKDLDVEVFGLQPHRLETILLHFAETRGVKLNEVGKSFRVWKLRDSDGNEIDISLPRRDRKTGEGHKGFEVVADPFMSVEDAARRRDFTINAIMKNLTTDEIVDPFNGKQDLADGVIRMVDSNAFAEDSLRVLRALQFAGRFGFAIEKKTMSQMQKTSLTDLPAERVFGELEKLLLKASKPSDGLKHSLFPIPELDALWGVQQDPVWHPEGNVWIHTLMVVDEAAKLISDLPHEEALTVMLASLAHDFGKAPTTEFVDGHWRALGHSEAGVPLATAFLDRLNVHTVNGFDVRGQVLALVEHHLAPPQLFREFTKNTGVNIARSLRRLSRNVRLDLLARVSLADMLGRGVVPAEKDKSKEIFEWFLESARNCNVEKKGVEPLLKGRHLIEMGMKPGKEMGEILKQAFELQLDGKITSLDEAKIWFAKGTNCYDDYAVPSLAVVNL